MNEIDIEILNALKENGRATASEISKKISLSVPATAERIRKMERSGIIDGYTVRVNNAALGYKLLAFVFVTLEGSADIDHFRERIVKENSVLECHHVAGDKDYILKVLVRDTGELEKFISDKLKRIKGVASSSTVISLSTLKEKVNV